MGRNRTNSHRLRFMESGSSSRTANPSNSISESPRDLRLPQELVTEIIVRLPVKSLLKFKCVSKSWLSLISSPQFIRSHFSLSSMEGDYVNHQLLFTFDNPAPGMRQCSLYSALYEAEPSTHVYDIENPYPSQNPDHSLWIVGIVNGLVCLCTRETELFLWNPVLRKMKQLPSFLEAPCTGFTYGFGYDESNDDYKVFSFARVLSESVFEDEVKVYSLRADSWKRIEDLKGFLPTLYHGMYANGKIYWSARKPGVSTPIKKILSLDMLSEKYGELQQPDYEAGYYDWILGVLCGRPIVLCDYKGRKADLWVMDKYGVEDSWCKVVSIPYRNVYPEAPYSHQRVLCILSNGDIVLENAFGLLVYHSKHNEFRSIELDVGSSSYFMVAPYSCEASEQVFWPEKMTSDSSSLWKSLLLLVLVVPVLSYSNMINVKVLHVGKELKKETLPLNTGSCFYQLERLQSHKWYEVKISYPASIPSSFSIRLKRGRSDLGLNLGRKLLNTEKLIFKTDSLDLLDDQGGLFVEVNVEPEGVVAIPGIQERKHVIFNIVCDELL